MDSKIDSKTDSDLLKEFLKIYTLNANKCSCGKFILRKYSSYNKFYLVYCDWITTNKESKAVGKSTFSNFIKYDVVLPYCKECNDRLENQ